MSKPMDKVASQVRQRVAGTLTDEMTEPRVDDPINILIVDDEPANLVVLETVLDDADYRLVRAQSADQALMALVREEFALLILDIRMPGMTGFELAQMIKDRKKTASVPIIFLTAYYDKDQHVLQGYGTGAVDFLNKPVNPAVLRSKVSVFADLHRKSRAVAAANRALRSEIEERRRAEERLQELNHTLEQRVEERSNALRLADKQLREMMGSISDGLLMFDRNWIISYANEEGARVLGLPRATLLGACVRDLSPLRLSTQSLARFAQALETRQTVSFEEFIAPPESRWLQCHCYPSEAGLSVYFLDITTRRELETRREALLEAERAARNESERVARAKEEFLASLSHELRTPLAAILGWVHLLQRDGVPMQTVDRGVDVISRNAQALAQLVGDLLDVSRIVSGKMKINAKRVDLNALVITALDSARPAARTKGVELVAQLADDGIAVSGDPSRLLQVVTNLITNAIKFTPSSGTVTVSVWSDKASAFLEVADTGQGIAAEFLPHLFERFSQADGSAARTHGGLGLGLSIVKSLVELHSGEITADSAGVGKGSRFMVRMPLALGGTEHDAAAGADERANGPGVSESRLRDVSVLLVDDHAHMLELQGRLLSDTGARVTTAASAKQAIEILNDRRFDVLLCDLSMPGMDGYDLIKFVRTGLGIGAEHMPAAAVTALVRAEDERLALDEGYQMVLHKPVAPLDLSRAVSHLLAWRSALPSADPAAAMAQVGCGGRKLRGLLVEDNVDFREQVAWLLEEERIELVQCASAEEAEVEFGRAPYDLVITDVSLPGMSGVALAKRLLQRVPALWLIFSTGYDMGNELTPLGPNVRVLLKPFEPDRLGTLVKEIRAQLGLA